MKDFFSKCDQIRNGINGKLRFLCSGMIELWMIYRALCKYFDTVVKVKNYELTKKENQNFQIFSEYCPQDKKSTHSYIYEFSLKSHLLRNFDTPSREMTTLDFVVRNEYQFLKNLFSEDEIARSKHLSSLENYYDVMRYMLRMYIYLQR